MAPLCLLAAACGVSPLPGAGPTSPRDAPSDRANLHTQVWVESGGPAAGAWITLDPRGFEAQTDATGSASLERLPPGDVTVWAALDGATAKAEITLLAGEDVDLELVLPTPPARGARVTVRSRVR